jgi:hypothetical protein
VLILLLGLSGFVRAQDAGQYSSEGQLDQKAGVFILTLTFPVTGPIKPETKYEIETRAQVIAGSECLRNVSATVVDSGHNLEDLFEQDASILDKVKKVSLSGQLAFSVFSRDKKNVLVRYDYPVRGDNGLYSCLVTHVNPVPVPHYLGFVPTKKFSGIVIYARGDYPVYGTKDTAKLAPALFPRILDEKTDVLLAREMVDPEYLRQWGMVAYSPDWTDKDATARIGSFPCYLMAMKIFGKHPTDIILPQDAADRLIASEENRALLKEGRVLVVIDEL